MSLVKLGKKYRIFRSDLDKYNTGTLFQRVKLKTFPPVYIMVNNMPVELYEGDYITINKIYAVAFKQMTKCPLISVTADISKAYNKPEAEIEREINSIDYIDETERLEWK